MPSIKQNNRKIVYSYGIILEYNNKVLVVKKCYSLAMSVFMTQHKQWTTADLTRLISDMRFDEQKAIFSDNPKKLFDEFWKEVPRHYKYSEFKDYYKSLKINSTIDKKEITTNNSSSSPDYYFPKGRKAKYESGIEAAKRELFEETNISEEYYNVLPDIPVKIECNYFNPKNVVYVDIFYKAVLCKPLPANHKYLDIRNKNQIKEISDAKWVNSKSISFS